MSFAVFQQLSQSTVIDECIVSTFTDKDVVNVVLVSGSNLEVHELQAGKQSSLRFCFSVSLLGRPDGLVSFRPEEGALDHLVLVFKRGRYLSVLKYDPEFGVARTCGQHVLLTNDDPASARAHSGYHPQVVADPDNRCLAVRCLPDRVAVLPIGIKECFRHDSGPILSELGTLAFHQDPDYAPCLGSPFFFNMKAPIRLHHLQDMAFLHGYHQPTLACLGQHTPSFGGCLEQAYQGNSSVLIVVLDLQEKAPHLIWASHSLPHDAFRVLPLRPPATGVLTLCSNAVIYVKPQGPSFCQTLNAAAKVSRECSELIRQDLNVKDNSELAIVLQGCNVTVIEPTVLLFALYPTGRLYLAHLVMGSRDAVDDIVWTCPGNIGTSVRRMCTVGVDHVFLVTASGGSPLLKVQAVKKKLPSSLQPKRKKSRVLELVAEAEATDKKDDAKDESAPPRQTASKELKELLDLHESMRDAARNLRSYNVQPVEELPTFGSIRNFEPWCRENAEDEETPLCGTSRFMFCSGAGSKGFLYVIQRAVPLEVMVEFDVDSQCSAVWTLRQPADEPMISENSKKRPNEDAEESEAKEKTIAKDDARSRPHRFVLVAGQSKTMLLEATAEIEEISALTPLDVSATTVCSGSLRNDRLVVQVTRRHIVFMSAANPRSKEVPSPVDLVPDGGSGAEVFRASVCDPFLLVVFTDGSLRLFRTNETDDSTAPPIKEVRKGKAFPASIARVICASLYRSTSATSSKVLLIAVTPEKQGMLYIMDAESMVEVFCTGHLADVPPVLRASDPDANMDGRNCHLDHLRAISDPCATLPKSAAAEAARIEAATTGKDVPVIAAELVDVDAGDRGPTLVVVVVGRPLLVYRSFSVARPDFPFHFRLCEHSFLGLVESKPLGPYRPVADFRHPQGTAGVVVSPPHTGIPALWLTASRNQLFIHPLAGDQTRSFAPLHAPCSEGGFFALSQGPSAVAAQILALSTLEGLPQASSSFRLQAQIPHVRLQLPQMPECFAARPSDGLLALAVSETVFESADIAGPNIDEDPLADDWSIVREPPVKVEPAPMPRMQPRHELWIDDAKDLGTLGKFKFSFDADEHVLSMAWVNLPSFPSPSLAVGTGVNIGEDLTCRGRLLIFSTKDKEPGILPAVYQRSLKWPVTVVGQWGEYFVHSEGFKLFFERWENGSFNKLAFYDGNMCITSLAQIKNFLLLGDLRKGLDFAQWKEDPSTQAKNLRRLSRSSPATPMTVLSCDFVVCGKSLGLVALDHLGNAHLFQYSPHSDGREGDQLLRSRATFAMGSACRAAARLQIEPGVQGLIMGSTGGDLSCLKPIDEQVYRTATTLLGMLGTRLPFCCGLNPRGFRHNDGPIALVAPRKNIEDTLLLRMYAFLSSPLQNTIAEKMRLPVLQTLQTTLPCASCQLHALKPEDPSAGEIQKA